MLLIWWWGWIEEMMTRKSVTFTVPPGFSTHYWTLLNMLQWLTSVLNTHITPRQYDTLNYQTYLTNTPYHCTNMTPHTHTSYFCKMSLHTHTIHTCMHICKTHLQPIIAYTQDTYTYHYTNTAHYITTHIQHTYYKLTHFVFHLSLFYFIVLYLSMFCRYLFCLYF